MSLAPFRVLVVACGCALASCATAPAPPLSAPPRSAAPPREWKVSTALGPLYPQGRAGELWAALIRERSDGRLAARHFPGAALAYRDPAREFGLLRDGTIDLAVGFASNWAPQVRQLNLIALPWLFPDVAALDRVLGGDVGARLSESVRAAGVVPLAWASDAIHELAAVRGVHAPGDLEGMRVGVPPSPLVADTLLALGALPSAMGSAPARAALARGELDAEETSVAAYAAARSYAAGARHLLLWGAHAEALVFVINRAVWDALPDADRELVRQAARDAAAAASAVARQQSGEAALSELGRDGGVTVTRLTEAGKLPFRRAARAVYDRWTAVVGEDLVREAEAAIAAR